MKEILTTIGTSIITNSIKNNPDKKAGAVAEAWFEKIKKTPDDNWEGIKIEIESLRKYVAAWVDNVEREKISAEVHTLLKMQKKLGAEGFLVKVISTESIASVLSSQILKGLKIEGITFGDIVLVKGMQVSDSKKMSAKGVDDLAKSIRDLLHDEKGMLKKDVVLNISGGYKAFIPYITIMAQIYGIDMYYIHEDSKELITIPPLPVHFDWSIAEKYYPYLSNPNELSKAEKSGLTGLGLAIEMNKYKLIVKTGSKYSITEFGKILKEELESNTGVSKSTMGHFVEYKVLECLNNCKYTALNGVKFFYPERSVEFPDKYSKSGKREMDILLYKDKKKTNEVVVMEIKSFMQIGICDYLDKTVSQIHSQLDVLKYSGLKVAEYVVVLYSLGFDNKLNTCRPAYERITADVKKKLGCSFRMYHLKIELEKNDKPYEKFMHGKIGIEELLELKFN